jgi:predicted GIY-YIG superfamily endonuclease
MNTAPEEHYVYVLRSGETVTYIGYSSNVDSRLASHRRNLRGKFDRVELIPVASRADGLRRETELIQELRPGQNMKISHLPAEAKRITVDMDDGLYEELRRAAYVQHKAMAEIVRMVLAAALVKEKQS